MRHKQNILRAVLASSTLVLLICVPLLLFGCISLSFRGYGVDSAGNLYVGRDHKINVYDNGELVNTIQRFTDRSYAFTIMENDTILLSTSTTIYRMDLSGTTILEEYPDSNSEMFYELLRQKYAPKNTAADKYTAARIWGKLTIKQNGEIIYQTPYWEHFVIILFLMSIPCFMVSIWSIKRQPQVKDN